MEVNNKIESAAANFPDQPANFIYRAKPFAVAQLDAVNDDFLVENTGQPRNHRARFADQRGDFGIGKFLPNRLQSRQRENHIAHLPEMYDQNILRIKFQN